MAIKVQGTTIIDDSRNIVNGIGASFTGIVTASSFSGDGSGLTGIGGTGEFIQDADGNLFAGTGAGGSYDPATGDACFNIFLGCNAGNSITSGDYNTAIGKDAGKCLTSGGCNNFLGLFAGFCNTTGSNNTFLGQCAGYGGTGGLTGNHNTAIGQDAGKCLTSGAYNTFFGDEAGRNNSTGSWNNFFGKCTGYDNTCGSCNNFFGCNAGKSNTSGCGNNFFGYVAGSNNTCGCYNNFIGHQTGWCNTTGNDNNFLGFKAGQYNITGTNNNFFGHCAGRLNTAGYNNFLGRAAGYCNTTGCHNTFLGFCAGHGGSGGVTGNHNTAIGQDAGKCLTSGTYNNFFGDEAGRNNSTGSWNNFFGKCTGYDNTCGSCNNFFGCNAGKSNTSGCGNNFFGQSAGRYNTTASNNNFFGTQSGCKNCTGSNNNFLGYTAGFCNTTGSYNTFIGQSAGYGGSGGVTGDYNTAIGQDAGKCLTSGEANVFLGRNTGNRTTDGDCNFFSGYGSGYCNTTGCNNLAIGYDAGRCLTTNNQNIFLGQRAGYVQAAGAGNIGLGICAGSTQTSGNYNIALGFQVNHASTTGSAQLAIGCVNDRWIAGDSSFNVTIANKLQVNASGIVTASSGIITYYGDGSQLTGIQGGAAISTETSNQAQYIPYATSFGSTTGFGATTLLVYNPSTSSLGIGTTNPLANLHVVDEFLVAAGSATTQHITQRAYELENGSLSWEGTAGQLFSITNNLTSGSIFSVNDVSGIPSIDVDADGTIQLAPFGVNEKVGIGTTNPLEKLHVVGVVSATSFYGDGSQLTGIQGGAAISTETSNQAQYIPYATSFGSTTGFGATTLLVYNPSTSSLGIGITNPTSKLHISGSSGNNVTVRANPGPVYIGSVSQNGGTSLTLTGLESGDLVLFMGVADSVSVPTPQTDSVNWSVPPGITNNSTSAPFRGIFYNFATGPSITATFTSTNVGYAMFAFRNVDSSTPFDVNATSTSTSGAMPDCPSITPVTNNSLIIAAGFLDDDQVASTTGAPTGYTLATAIDNSLSQSTLMVAYKLLETAAAEDPGAFTDSSGLASDSYVADTLALRPAAPLDDFVIKSNGDVGIGTTNPLAKLHVVGVVSATSFYGDGSQLQNVGLSLTDDTSTNATRYILFDDTTSGSVSSINVSSTKLTYNPSTGELTSTLVTSSSDERLKENIRTIDDPLNKVLSLRGVEFDRIDNGDHQIGVIAQEVEKVIPQVVYGTDTKTVAYGNLVGLLIEALKEQNRRIDELERRLGEG